MEFSDDTTQQYLQQTREIIVRFEENNIDEAHKLLDELTGMREMSLFQELGKLTREFHEALNSFRLDARLTRIAGEEIPDAKERLRFVIKKTDEAAHRTLTVVEAALPTCDRIESDASALKSDWARFTSREMGAAEFRELSKRLSGFFQSLDTDISDMKSGLTDVLMAQDFQDITGQVIGRVIELVSDLEDSLVNLIRISGGKIEETAAQKSSRALDGPQVPGIESDSAVSGQDEVDDLLSSLGF